MDKLRIVGGRRLSGSVRIGGAKNASLPAMAAALLTEERVNLSNLPDVWDVGTMRRLLSKLGVACESASPGAMTLAAPNLLSWEAPYELVKTMRASVLVLGPLVARAGRARVSLPGGCAIGARPIDLHIEGLEALGARIAIEHGFVEAEAERLAGARFRFRTVSVTGTENLMMAASLARGTTVLDNAAREPEVVDLAGLLNAMGARVQGAGGPTIEIEGVERLHGTSHAVLPDRIEAGTYIVAGALVGDGVTVTGLRSEHLGTVLDALAEAGVALEVDAESVTIAPLPVLRAGAPRLRPIEVVTAPYPGFATDMQAQLMVLLTQADGTSTVSETIFENRFMHVAELYRMGARIELQGHRALVHGPTPLSGATVMATDLRASASLVLAALLAEGETTIDRVYHLDRGYEQIERKLGGLGADVTRLS